MAASPRGVWQRATCGQEELDARESVAVSQTDDLSGAIGMKLRCLELFDTRSGKATRL